MKLILLTILILLNFSFAENKNVLPIYGYYCGKDNHNQYGIQPLDDLDRQCQIHDICVAASSLIDCYCSTQLYLSVSSTVTTNMYATKVKNEILSFTYPLISICENGNSYHKRYFISGTDTKKNNRGYNYIPLFEYIRYDYLVAGGSSELSVYKFTPEQYIEFGKTMVDRPTDSEKFKDNIFNISEKNIVYSNVISDPDDIYVVVNHKSEKSVTIYVFVERNMGLTQRLLSYSAFLTFVIYGISGIFILIIFILLLCLGCRKVRIGFYVVSNTKNKLI